MEKHDPRCPCGYPRSTCWRCSNPETDPDDPDNLLGKKLVRIDLERLSPDETPIQTAERLGVMLLEPRTTYDQALVGIARMPADRWPRTTDTPCAVYDTLKCVEAIMAADDMEFDQALDWFDYNTAAAWMGEGTPTFVELLI